MDKLKKCSGCKMFKSLIEFPKNKSQPDRFHNYCRICHSKNQKIRRDLNPEKMKDYERKSYIKNIRSKWASEVLHHHKKNGNKIELTFEELSEMAKYINECPLCGRILNWSYGRGLTMFSPSLDRINNENVLHKNNIRIICYSCNATKGARSMQEFIDYCNMISKKFGEL